ncbi:MAG: hypothetical protein ABSC48_13275 [Terracidiphilus sp.]|jgi:hypothetical protein
MTQSVLDKTRFLNVDLDVRSKSDLQPLADAMGKKVIVLHVGRFKRTYEAHLELSGSPLPQVRHPKSPEMLILGFCRLVQELPPGARELWDSAKTRTFDIGIEAPGPSNCYWSAISPKALRAASEINAHIAVTVYGPMKRAKVPGKSRRVKSTNSAP